MAGEGVRRSRRAFGQRPGGVARAALLWPLLLVLPLLFGAAGALSAVQLEKPAAQRATAQVRNVLLSPPFVGGGHQSRFWSIDPLAREKNLVERVLRAANVSGLTEAEFLDHSRVAARSYSDLDFSVTSTSSATAIRLANIYASEYANSHTQQVRESIGKAIRRDRANIALLPHTPLRTTLEQEAKQVLQTRRLEFSSVLQKASATTPGPQARTAKRHQRRSARTPPQMSRPAATPQSVHPHVARRRRQEGSGYGRHTCGLHSVA